MDVSENLNNVFPNICCYKRLLPVRFHSVKEQSLHLMRSCSPNSVQITQFSLILNPFNLKRNNHFYTLEQPITKFPPIHCCRVKIYIVRLKNLNSRVFTIELSSTCHSLHQQMNTVCLICLSSKQ